MIGFDQESSCMDIIRELQLDPAENASLIKSLGDLWSSFADKAALFPRLQYWYTKRAAADKLLGGNWTAIEWEQAGVHEKGGELFDNTLALRNVAHAEITRLEGVMKATVAPAGMTQLTATAPVMTPPGYANPNWEVYRGDPRFPLLRTRV